MVLVNPNDNRRVKPDCEEIRNLIDHDPLKRSADKIFKSAELRAGSRLLRSWEQGKSLPFRNSLERLAKVLHGCEDVDQIIDNTPYIPTVELFDSNLRYYRELVIDGLHSPDFLLAIEMLKGSENVYIGDFMQEYFRRELYELGLSLAQMDEVHRALSRMGWLRRLRQPGGDRYVRREWHRRQISWGYRNRVAAEKNGILYAFSTSYDPLYERAQEEFKVIVEQQMQTLKKLETATSKLIEAPTIRNAIEVINLDSRFHCGWAGWDPSTSAMLSLGLSGHLPSIGFLVDAHLHLERKGIPLPDKCPTLAEVVQGFHGEINKLFDDFLKATEEKSRFAIRPVIANAKKHARDGFDFVDQANELIRISRPPGA